MPQETLTDQNSLERGRRVLTFLALILILIGQVIIIPTQPAAPIPLMFLLTALGLVLFIWAQAATNTRVIKYIGRNLSVSSPWAWIAVAVVLTAITTFGMLLFEIYGYANYTPILILWFISAGCYLTAYAPAALLLVEWKQWLKKHLPELTRVGLITLAAFALRFYKLGVMPRILNGDEGWLGNTALSSINLPYANPFALWENFGALYLQAINLIFGWLGVSPFSLRLLPAIGGTLAVPAIYLLGRQIGNHRIGLMAAVLVAFSHTHIHFSRTSAVAYIHSTWLVPLELYFLLSGLKRQQPWRAALGGVLLGFHFSIYLTSQIITALVFIYMLVCILLFRTQLRAYFRVMAAFWGGLFIVLLPHAVYIFRHPNEFFARLSVDGTFQSGWLANRMADTGQSAVQILSERVLHAFLSLIYYPAFDFYGSRIPMLTLFTAALFLLGLGISLWRTRSPGYLLLNGYFWATTLSVGVFSIPASADSYRMLITFPAALIMAALAIEIALSALGIGWEQRKRGYMASVSVLLLSVALYNIWVYYFDFIGRCRYGTDNPQTRYYSYLGSYLGAAPKEASVFLLSDEAFPYPGNPAIEFLSGNRQVTSTNDAIDTLDLMPGDIVIADPNRIDELAAWSRTHPGGARQLELDCGTKILLIYQLP